MYYVSINHKQYKMRRGYLSIKIQFPHFEYGKLAYTVGALVWRTRYLCSTQRLSTIYFFNSVGRVPFLQIGSQRFESVKKYQSASLWDHALSRKILLPTVIGHKVGGVYLVLVAQLVEHWNVNPEVAGSCPVLHPISQSGIDAWHWTDKTMAIARNIGKVRRLINKRLAPYKSTKSL